MRNPFKWLCHSNKEIPKQKVRDIVQVFTLELCEKLRGYGAQKLHVTIVRPNTKDTIKELTGEEIIRTFAHEFELKAFTEPSCVLVQANNAIHTILLVGLQKYGGHEPFNLLTLQIRE